MMGTIVNRDDKADTWLYSGRKCVASAGRQKHFKRPLAGRQGGSFYQAYRACRSNYITYQTRKLHNLARANSSTKWLMPSFQWGSERLKLARNFSVLSREFNGLLAGVGYSTELIGLISGTFCKSPWAFACSHKNIANSYQLASPPATR